MKVLFLACLLLCAVIGYAQQPPVTPPVKKQFPKNRTDAGFGLPQLFSAEKKKEISRAPVGTRQQNLDAILNEAFDKKKLRDTLRLSYANGQLVAIIMTRGRSGDLEVINLKVISHQNAFMRLERAVLQKKGFQYAVTVMHPDYSDALTLRAENGSLVLVQTPLSEIVNE